jgi:general secretion pathway protein H
MMRAGTASFKAPGGQGGMTLVEMLVVLAIIAIIAGTVSLSLGSGRGLAGQAEARRLTASLQLAADQTMITDDAIALAVRHDGYTFVAWDRTRGKWMPETDPALGERHDLPAGLALRSDTSRNPLPLGAGASGEAFVLTLSGNDRAWDVEFDGMTAHLAARRLAAAGVSR